MYIKATIFAFVLLFTSIASAQQNVVLLKNGNILQGSVEQDGVRVQIRTSSSRIVIEKSDVAYFCNSLNEAYELTQAASNPESVDSQVAVFQWCMKHKMFRQAEEQIGILQLMPIKRTQLEHLNRQVNVAINRENRKQQAASQLQPKSALAGKPSAMTDGRIAQVGYEKPIEITSLPSTDDAGLEPVTTRPATLHEISQFTKSFPRESISAYKRSIEPQLIKNCFNAGCHNPDQKNMPLLSLGRGKTVSKTMSQRNFHTLMQYVDLDAPLASPLYEKATTAHAGLAKAVYTDERGQTKTLRDWLVSIASPKAQQDYRQHQFEIARKAAEKAALDISIGDSELKLPGEIRQASANLTDASIPSVPNLHPDKKTFVPKDPFDPEIFNRKFGKQ